MSILALAPLALRLDELQLARAVLLLGCGEFRPGPPFERWEMDIQEARGGGEPALFVLDLSRLYRALHGGPGQPPSELLDRSPVWWDAQWQQATYGWPLQARLLVVGNAPPGLSQRERIDPLWLAGLFHASFPPIVGVVIEAPPTGRAVRWNFPLQVGVLGSRADALAAALQASPYPELFTVAAVPPVPAQYDVVLCAEPLAEALAAALQHPDLRGSVVLATGRPAGDWSTTEAYALALRQACLAEAVALADLWEADVPDWFNGILAQLGHDRGLDEALWQAAASSVLFAPLGFVLGTRISRFARRLGELLEHHPDPAATLAVPGQFSADLGNGQVLPLQDFGRRLGEGAGRLAWVSEHQDGSALARVAAELARRDPALAPPPRLPAELAGTGYQPFVPGGEPESLNDWLRPGAVVTLMAAPRVLMAPPPPLEPFGMAAPTAGAEPPQEAAAGPPAEPRRVVFRLFADTGRGYRRRGMTFKGGEKLRVDVRIGWPREDEGRAPAPIPEHELDRAESVHPLRLVFCELLPDERGEARPPQVADIGLPRDGESASVPFHFIAPPEPGRFRARLIVLYRNRVFQTLMFGAIAPARLRGRPAATRASLFLDVENIVSPGFGEEDIRPDPALALVVNDVAGIGPTLAAVTAAGASFVLSEPMKEHFARVRKTLGRLNTFDEQSRSLEDDDLRLMLVGLANSGAELHRKLLQQLVLHGDAVPGDGPILVVDAVSEVWLPAEFFYEGPAPDTDAAPCPNALKALADEAVHRDCPHRRDPRHVCPMSFWGFGRSIERAPHRGHEGHLLATPTAADFCLAPLKSAVVGISRKVSAADAAPPEGIEGILARALGACVRANTWREWEQQVGAAPSLLVLVAHTQEDPVLADHVALEISGQSLPVPQIRGSHVRPDPAARPVALLLGCSTSVPDVPFSSFVSRFAELGAVFVIGTLATIRGRQTVGFLQALVAELAAAAAAPGTRSFNEVVLAVKRASLAAGNPFALSITTYGEGSWRISP